MKKGDRVKFICNDPSGKLKTEGEYIIKDITEHPWHTEIILLGIDGRFDSVCFDVV